MLLIQEAKRECRGAWYLPAGRMEPGESIVDALQREVKEEAGLLCQPLTLLAVEERGPAWIRFAFLAQPTGTAHLVAGCMCQGGYCFVTPSLTLGEMSPILVGPSLASSDSRLFPQEQTASPTCFRETLSPSGLNPARWNSQDRRRGRWGISAGCLVPANLPAHSTASP